ncbi:hypothetical protein BKA70DRAFT_1439301 [Coprinopsis sp. MPI-PUGE-AT-0042]|nr:hypothetical protein BKA70DRAFT_1439301 [Coprinopsis sp. MPI-PUGE-AT-0042]
MLVEREAVHLQALLASFKAEEAFGDNATPSVDETEELGAFENMNDLEALDGPLVSTEELEKVEQEKKALRQTNSEHEQEIVAQAARIDELKPALFDLSGEIAGGRYAR